MIYPDQINLGNQVGSVVSFPAFHLWGPRFESHLRALHVDWVFSPYLIAWVFLTWRFPPASKTEHFFLFPIHPVIGANYAVGCVIK